MNKAKRNLQLSSALLCAPIGVLLVPAIASAAAVSATPASPWPGASVRLEASGFAPRASGIASMAGVPPVAFRVNRRGRATMVLRLPGSGQRGVRALRVHAGSRSVLSKLFVVDSRRASSTMVALSGGQRVSLDPASGPAGAGYTLRATGFTRGSTLGVRFGGAPSGASKRLSRRGGVTIAGTVPASAPGERIVRVVSGRTNVALRFFVLDAPASPVEPSSFPEGATPPPPPPPRSSDRTAPAVSVTAPANGATVSGTAVPVIANANDDVGVSGVRFFLDGAALGAEDTSAPYSTTWNTTTSSAGNHKLTAVARDEAANSATSSAVSVTVADRTLPSVSVTAPANGATVGGTAVPVIATATDDSGVRSVQFRLDGSALGAPDTSAPYSATWNTTTASDGSTHTLTAVASDAFANTTPSAGVSVRVDNSATRRIAAAGDIACSPLDPNFNAGVGTSGACRQMATSDLLVGRGYSDVLTLGDAQYDCATPEDFAGSFHPSWGRVKPIFHPATGNHEYKCDSAAGGYFGYFGGAAGPADKGYYSFDIGSWHVISLNTNNASSTGCPQVSCSAGSAQESWLRADLAANRAACTIAIWHHPLFSSKPAGVSGASRAFWNDLYAAGAEIVLNGHVHNYERFNPQTPGGTADPITGVAQFVVGSGGVGLESAGTPVANSAAAASKFGVLELTLNPASYSWRFVTAAGQSAFNDAGSANCH